MIVMIYKLTRFQTGTTLPIVVEYLQKLSERSETGAGTGPVSVIVLYSVFKKQL